MAPRDRTTATPTTAAPVAQRAAAIGEELQRALEAHRPPLFSTAGLLAPVVRRALADTAFRTALFRFIDCLPALRSAAEVVDHLEAYFREVELPPVLERALHLATRRWSAAATAAAVRRQVRALAAQFIAAGDPGEAGAVVARLASEGIRVTVDLLGERTCSEAEAEAHLAGYQALMEEVAGHAPAGEGSLSVKVSALDPRLDPVDAAGGVARLARRLGPLLEAAGERRLLVYLDMEDRQLKGMTLDLFERLVEEHPELRLGCVLQAYLRETPDDLERVVALARRHPGRIAVRLVKGAYWDTEVARARQRGWPIPVYTRKEETDRAFDLLAERLLGEAEVLYPAIASHNAASLGRALAVAELLGLGPDRFEVQVLYGMGEALARVLVARGLAVRTYVPVGELIPGMAYFVRRLLENTANTSFLRRTYAPEVEEAPPPRVEVEAAGGFANEPHRDFAEEAARSAFARALEGVRGRLGEEVLPVVGEGERPTGRVETSVNPARPEEVVARYHRVGREEAELAVAAAEQALPAWSSTPAEERAAVLRRAADWLAARREEAAAWEVVEAAKPWREADADVCEAIDFLRYYADGCLRLAAGHAYPSPPGERNRGRYVARGVAAVIAPWNFPLAIPTGMTAAALACGNTVCLKPALATVRVGRLLVEALAAAGLPPGVLQYLPGRGPEVGAALVEDPRVALIAFTGSREVGLWILERAARVVAGQRHVKRVVCEMGGKNAIIVDADADLDEAVAAITASAFGYAGQKCSACSRVIAVGSVHGPLLARLGPAVESLQVGDPADPATQVPPLIDAAAQEKVHRYLAIGEGEGRCVARAVAPEGGFYVAPALFDGVEAHHRLAREEIFGPVLSLLRAADLEEAVAVANATDYALTGGLLSRHPGHVEFVVDRFQVGNLYVNRGITGAIVGRQPFGGFALSGIGSQAGGPDYLLQFCLPRTVCENTLRRGFAPETLAGLGPESEATG